MNVLERALIAKLRAASGVTSLLAGTASVYSPMAPEAASLPYVIVQKQANTPRYTNAALAFEDAVYLVKGVVQSTSAALAGSIASAIDVALTDQPLSISGYKHLLTRRISDVDYPEVVAGAVFQHRGASYRVVADPN